MVINHTNSSRSGSASCQPDAWVDDVSIPGCLCTPGTTGDDGGPCTTCVRDTFKNSTGSSNYTSCAVNETSTEGSISCVCEENYFGVSGDCETCPLDLVSPQNITECFCTDGGLLTNGTCATILSERLHLTGVFGDDTSTPEVMSHESRHLQEFVQCSCSKSTSSPSVVSNSSSVSSVTRPCICQRSTSARHAGRNHRPAQNPPPST